MPNSEGPILYAYAFWTIMIGRKERERDVRAYTKTQDHCALQRQVELGLQTGNRVSPGPEVS